MVLCLTLNKPLAKSNIFNGMFVTTKPAVFYEKSRQFLAMFLVTKPYIFGFFCCDQKKDILNGHSGQFQAMFVATKEDTFVTSAVVFVPTKRAVFKREVRTPQVAFVVTKADISDQKSGHLLLSLWWPKLYTFDGKSGQFPAVFVTTKTGILSQTMMFSLP